MIFPLSFQIYSFMENVVVVYCKKILWICKEHCVIYNISFLNWNGMESKVLSSIPVWILHYIWLPSNGTCHYVDILSSFQECISPYSYSLRIYDQNGGIFQCLSVSHIPISWGSKSGQSLECEQICSFVSLFMLWSCVPPAACMFC